MSDAAQVDATPGSRASARELLARYVPISGWLPRYPRAWLGKDISAGITAWAVMVPVSMAYAELAGVPAGAGLITATAGLTAYAVLGTSRHAKVTTSSTMAVMSASVVAPAAGGDEATYVAMTAMLAIIVGLYLVAAGILRLGFLAEFLAKPVITGFIVGLAITIAVGQLPKLFGVEGGDGNAFEQLGFFITQLPETNEAALLLGLAAMAVIIIARRIDRRIPGPLIAVAGAILLSTAFGLADRGVAVVGELAAALEEPGMPSVSLSDLTYLATGAVGIMFLALAESLAADRAFANRHGYRIRSDQELIALGGSNISSGLLGGFAVDNSVSSMSTGEAAGNKTQLSSLVTAAGMLLTILLLSPLFTNLPQTLLAAVIITSVISLVDFAEWRRYVQWRKTDAALALIAMFGVLLTDVLTGLVIAAAFSVVILLYTASKPAIARLGRLPGPHEHYVDADRNPEAETVEGLLILRLDTPLYYFNATAVSDRVLRAVDALPATPDAVLLDIEATIELDVTTSDALFELLGALEDRGTRLVIVHAKGTVRDRMRKVGLMERLGTTGLYPNERIAIDALHELGSAAGVARQEGSEEPADEATND
ncbi:MAG: SulP family inorganic anion transporter [Chloroflexota bacterium]|jgi:high affinity sulfate transporter 1